MDYYENAYNLKIKDPNQPLLLHKAKIKSQFNKVLYFNETIFKLGGHLVSDLKIVGTLTRWFHMEVKFDTKF